MIVPKCQICGKPATRVAQDMAYREIRGVKVMQPFGLASYGCEDHPVYPHDHGCLTAYPGADDDIDMGEV